MEVIKFIVAYFDALILLGLAGIYPLSRIMVKKHYPDDHKLVKLEAFLRRHHKRFGMLLIVVTIIHAGLTHELSVLGLIMFGLSLLIGLTYCFKKMMKYHWLTIHRLITVIILILLVGHIIFDVKR